MIKNGFTWVYSKNTPIPPRCTPAEKPGPLCILACQWCNLPEFWEWINATDFDGVRHYIPGKNEAAEFLQKTCKITSRKDLDLIKSSAVVFEVKVRKPFMAWQAAKVAA